MALGRLGIWRRHQEGIPPLAELEALGFTAVWVGGSPSLDEVRPFLEQSTTLTVLTGVLNVWRHEPGDVAVGHARLRADFGERFLLGVGIGHPEATRQYRKPYDTIVQYLDQLDAEGVPVAGRALAALGPKVLRLAAERTLGAHPYLVTPEHTREAREIMGAGPLLAPEQKVVLDTDPVRARAIARPRIQPYLGMSNYLRNLRRLGFTDEDLAGEGSDRLIDALAVHGDAKTVARGITAHLDAGADHVPVQVLGDDPVPAYRALAELLLRD
jgi:probable F420-dependent oxidoreductase